MGVQDENEPWPLEKGCLRVPDVGHAQSSEKFPVLSHPIISVYARCKRICAESVIVIEPASWNRSYNGKYAFSE
jgi:hypothetical protein